MRSFQKYTLVSLLLVSVFSACQKDYPSISQVDEQRIQTYITTQKLNLTKDTSGIYYQILNQGIGEVPKNSEVIYFTYSAKSINGKVYYTPASYAVSSNFLGYVKPEGWRLALNHINKGGKIRVVFPSTLGFGRNGTGVFAGNDVLDCELELFNVNSQAEMDDVLINRFIAGNSLTGFTMLPSGIYYKIMAPGTGTEEIKLTSSLTFAYTGRLLNGTTFDSATLAKPFTSTLSSLIEGWKQTLPLLKKGGKIRLLIPSAFAYGAQGSGNISPNSVLDFDIEVTDVKN